MKRQVIAALDHRTDRRRACCRPRKSAGGWLRPEAMARRGCFRRRTKRSPARSPVRDRVIAAGHRRRLLTLAASRRGRMGLIVGVLLVEIAGVAWVCSLYKVSFQPLPAMVAVVLGYLGALSGSGLRLIWKSAARVVPKIEAGPTPRPAPMVIADSPGQRPYVAPQPVAPPPVVEKPRARARRGDSGSDSRHASAKSPPWFAISRTSTIWRRNCEPAAFAEITERFIAHAVQAFRAEGAYLESAGGEGVVAIFGFPESDKQHAERRCEKRWRSRSHLAKRNKGSKSDPFAQCRCPCRGELRAR